MQTDTVCAYQLENNDWVAEDILRGYPQGYVYMADDEGDWLTIDIVDDDGEHNVVYFGPFDPVTIITSFEE